MDVSAWKTACRFCGKLAETDECQECKQEFKITAITRAKSTTTKSPGRQGQSRDIAANVEGNFRDEAGLPSACSTQRSYFP